MHVCRAREFEIVFLNTFLERFHRDRFIRTMPLCLKNGVAAFGSDALPSALDVRWSLAVHEISALPLISVITPVYNGEEFIRAVWTASFRISKNGLIAFWRRRAWRSWPNFIG